MVEILARVLDSINNIGSIQTVIVNPELGISQQIPSKVSLDFMRGREMYRTAAEDGANLESAVDSASEDKPFTIIPIEASRENAGAILECLRNGFVQCGFDRNPTENNTLVLMLGKLKHNTLLAPTKVLGNILLKEQVTGIRKISDLFVNNS